MLVVPYLSFSMMGRKIIQVPKLFSQSRKLNDLIKLDMSGFVALERCLGACTLGLLVSKER